MGSYDIDPDDEYEHRWDIALTEEEAAKIREAVRKLETQAEIIAMAWSGETKYARELATYRIEDEAVIVAILMETHDPLIADKFVKLVKNQQLLANMATETCNDSKKHILIRLVNHIEDQHLLACVAKNACLFDTQKAAIQKIYDQDLLIDIAHEVSLYSGARLEAAKRITDPAVLLGLMKDKDPDVRRAAIKADARQELLEDILKNDIEHFVRRRAAMYINDKEILKEAAIGDESIHVRKYIITERLRGENELLREIVERSGDYKTRLAANMSLHKVTHVYQLIKITQDISLLKDIAEYDSEEHQLLALERISNVENRSKEDRHNELK